MKNILIAGAGTIGMTLARWLAFTQDYCVHLVDINTPNNPVDPTIHFYSLDINNQDALREYVKQNNIEAIVSTLPFFCNSQLAKFAHAHQLHYFDPTEDIHVTQEIQQYADTATAAFVPQCGLAPGFINIIANHYINEFNRVDKVKLRCGALPQNSSHALHYAFTWSPDGLINEYINSCQVIENYQLTQTRPLEGMEEIEIDGSSYEAFHTSGGLATLAQTHSGKIETMDYKTIRYPGHAEKMRFLLNDLKLREDRDNLKSILTHAIPFTDQDVVLVYVSVSGDCNGRFEKKSFTHKYYPQTCFGVNCSAIQLTTTAGLSAIIDIVLNNPDRYRGFIKQEQFSLDDLFNNRFGRILAPYNSTRKPHEHPTNVTIK